MPYHLKKNGLYAFLKKYLGGYTFLETKVLHFLWIKLGIKMGCPQVVDNLEWCGIRTVQKLGTVFTM
jgi:hypothetical protein